MASLLAQVKADLNKAARESAKGVLKNHFQKRAELKKAIEGVEEEIVAVLVGVGETEADVRALLNDDAAAAEPAAEG